MGATIVGIYRQDIYDTVKAAGLHEPEFIGGEVDLRINIYRGQVDTNNATINANDAQNAISGVKMALIATEVALMALKYRLIKNRCS